MKIATLLLLLILAVFPISAFADGNGTSGQTPDLTKNPANLVVDADGVFKAISNITNWIFSLFLVIAVIFILWGAFKLLTSGGGEGLVEARKMILYAAIAVVIAVLAKSIIIVAANIVGVQEIGTKL